MAQTNKITFTTIKVGIVVLSIIFISLLFFSSLVESGDDGLVITVDVGFLVSGKSGVGGVSIGEPGVVGLSISGESGVAGVPVPGKSGVEGFPVSGESGVVGDSVSGEFGVVGLSISGESGGARISVSGESGVDGFQFQVNQELMESQSLASLVLMDFQYQVNPECWSPYVCCRLIFSIRRIRSCWTCNIR